MDAVLLVPEITEAILSHLDMATLLVSATRVCKHWNQLIATSPKLQKALFFSAGGDEREEMLGWDPMDGSLQAQALCPQFNPLLVQKFSTCFFDFSSTYGYTRRAESFYTLPWTAEPYKHVIDDNSWSGETHYLSRPDDSSEEAQRQALEDRRRFTRKNASWRRMLVTQPPSRSMGFLRWNQDPGPRDAVAGLSAKVEQAVNGGLRMGELYDFVQHQACHPLKRSVWFRVVWGKPVTHQTTLLLKQYQQELYAQTSVVVECFDIEDGMESCNPKDPYNEAEFDAHFRSTEATTPLISYAEIKESPLRFYMEGTPGSDTRIRSSFYSPVRY